MKALFAATAVLGLVLAGAASAEPRQVSGFTGVDASSGAEVEITIGQAYSVDVSGPGAQRIITEVQGNVLRVHPQQTWGFSVRRRALVRITMPSLNSLGASSGAQVRAEGVRAADISLDASSGGDLTIAGTCRSVTADASSGAHLNAAHLVCERGTVDASSGGRADVNVNGNLDVDASSGGNVYAGGGAQIGSISLSSGGTLRRS